MRFGIFLGPHHAMDENPTLALERDLELVQLIDRLDFDEAWIGEHHSGGFEIVAAPEVFIAAAAERTKYLKLGTGVKSLPYHHPLIVADTLVLLDHLTRGRIMFGAGPGALPTDAYQMGIDPGELRGRMADAFDAVVALLNGETVTMKTGWFELDGARLQMAPYSNPLFELAVTSVRSPAGALAAGKHGAGLLVLGGTGPEALARQTENWRICEETAEKHGKSVDRANWRITAMMHLSESREQAISDMAFGLDKWVGYSRDVLPATPFPADVDDPLNWGLENHVFFCGTPDDAIAEIERVQRETGGFGVWLFFANNFAPWDATKKSYELFARYVMPHFKNAQEAQRSSYAYGKESHVRSAESMSSAVAQETEKYKSGRAD